MYTTTRIGTDLWRALSTGSTLPIRFALALQSLLFGLQIVLGLLGRPLPLADKWVMFETMAPTAWAVALIGSGLLMAWRVLAARPQPWIAWTSNVFAFLTWFMISLSYAVAEGWRGLVGMYSVALLMAIFCVLRTEATHRDRETA